MILEQFYLECLSQASYLIGDEDSGEAAVIDPRRDVEVYLEAAARRGLRILHVLLTHFHADFVSGHLELAARTGAAIHMGAAARADFAVEPMADGDELRLGGLRLRAMTTPGHTPESTCFLLLDAAGEDAAPRCVFTGDTLFVGDVGRPDLLASVGVTAEDLAAQLYHSLHEKLLKLPDDTVVYPGHGAGSACGKNLGSETSSTIGDQRQRNLAVQPMSLERFVALVTTDQPPAPAYFGRDAALNKRRHPLLEEELEGALRPLDPSSVEALVAQGAQLVDVRPGDSFAAGHLPGSVSVGLEGRFASWAGTVLDFDAPVVLVAEAGTEGEAALRLGRIGLRVTGFLDGGSHGLAGRLVHFERLAPRDLQARLSGEAPPRVLDVRAPSERAGSRIEGSEHLPLAELPARLGEIPRDRPVVCVCGGGYRSAIAASLLQRAGVPEVMDLRGGMAAWMAAELPIEGSGASCQG